MTNLSFIDSLPSECTEIDTFLEKEGFERKDQETADDVRWVYYSKQFKKDSSNALLKIVLRFELSIGDEPTASYNDNHQILFNDAYIEVWDRQMDQIGSGPDGPIYDEETEILCKVDRFEINPKVYADIQALECLLR